MDINNSKIKIKDILSVTNDNLGFRLNETDAHEVLLYLEFITGDFYKIVQYRSEFGLYCTLKHSYPHPELELYPEIKNKKIRELISNRWLRADKKVVSDGSINRDTRYLSGWHLFKDYQECKMYLDRFKNKNELTIIKVKACGLSKKEHSKSNIWLADEIFIPSDQN